MVTTTLSARCRSVVAGALSPLLGDIVRVRMETEYMLLDVEGWMTFDPETRFFKVFADECDDEAGLAPAIEFCWDVVKSYDRDTNTIELRETPDTQEEVAE